MAVRKWLNQRELDERESGEFDQLQERFRAHDPNFEPQNSNAIAEIKDYTSGDYENLRAHSVTLIVTEKLLRLMDNTLSEFRDKRQKFDDHSELLDEFELFSKDNANGTQLTRVYLRINDKKEPYTYAELIDIADGEAIHIEIHFISSHEISIHDRITNQSQSIDLISLNQDSILCARVSRVLGRFQDLLSSLVD